MAANEGKDRFFGIIVDHRQEPNLVERRLTSSGPSLDVEVGVFPATRKFYIEVRNKVEMFELFGGIRSVSERLIDILYQHVSE